jgi:DNA-directed RNA polymerase subunit M/transcription elongation factor TFIIS
MEPIRVKGKTKFYSILSQELKDKTRSDYLARNIEKGVYNFTVQKSQERRQQCSWDNLLFREIYISKLRQICGNLSRKSYINNVNIVQRLESDEFLPHEIAFMTCYELSPEHWKTTIADKEKKDSMMCEIDFGQATTQFWCQRCKKNQTTYYAMQTRSADESETIFITCLNCGKRWRK